jgi:hypothetical protein
MSDQTAVHKPRELAHRTSDEIEVTLLWTKLEDRLSVLVHDRRSGDHFELEPEPQRALEVFYHPYAYAAA